MIQATCLYVEVGSARKEHWHINTYIKIFSDTNACKILSTIEAIHNNIYCQGDFEKKSQITKPSDKSHIAIRFSIFAGASPWCSWYRASGHSASSSSTERQESWWQDGCSKPSHLHSFQRGQWLQPGTVPEVGVGEREKREREREREKVLLTKYLSMLTISPSSSETW